MGYRIESERIELLYTAHISFDLAFELYISFSHIQFYKLNMCLENGRIAATHLSYYKTFFFFLAFPWERHFTLKNGMNHHSTHTHTHTRKNEINSCTPFVVWYKGTVKRPKAHWATTSGPSNRFITVPSERTSISPILW